MNREEFCDRLIDILLKVRENMTDDSDVVWTRFETPAETRLLIDSHIEELRRGNMYLTQDMSLLFGPTGSFQEHSISNGWGKEFLILAEQFDNVCWI